MGREIRKVIPNWEHPRKEYSNTEYQPLFDKDVQTAFEKWMEGYQEWLSGGLVEALQKYPDLDYKMDEPYEAFCRWDSAPPRPQYYRPRWTEEEATWYQVYETVSEGTPITPPFATKDELIYYLCNYGTYWDRGKKWSREAAENFVNNTGWMVSAISQNGSIVDQTQSVLRY